MKSHRSAAQPGAPGRTPVVVVPFAFHGDDRVLVEGLREGHPGAKAALFERYASAVERIVTHVMGLDRELSDIVQEVFLRAFVSVHQLRDPDALGRWMARVAALTARKVLRTRSRRAWLRLFRDAEEEGRWDPPTATLDDDSRRALRAVYRVLGTLSADERIAFSLRFVEGMELVEIADTCGVSVSTVKRRLRRAEQRFVVAARKVPDLSEWMEERSRWKRPE